MTHRTKTAFKWITAPMIIAVLWFALQWKLSETFVRASDYNSHLDLAEKQRGEILKAIEEAKNDNSVQHSQINDKIDLILGKLIPSAKADSEKAIAEKK